MDEGVLDVKDYKNHPKKSVITKAIGDDKMPDIDTSKMILPNESNFKFFDLYRWSHLCTNDSATWRTF